MNVYDKASRYAAHLDAAGFLRWLMPDLPAAVSYNGWLDTRTLPFPGEADRTCDTVACFHDGAAGEWWAVPVEFQIEPDGEMFGRFMEFLGRLWRERRPAADGTARYKVGAAVVNLTGRGAGADGSANPSASDRTQLCRRRRGGDVGGHRRRAHHQSHVALDTTDAGWRRIGYY